MNAESRAHFYSESANKSSYIIRIPRNYTAMPSSVTIKYRLASEESAYLDHIVYTAMEYRSDVQ